VLRIGVDTGGTFTDFVVVHDGRVSTWKEPSSPADPSRAILQGIRRAVTGAALLQHAEVVHGSTVATNALLERKTARIAFVTNRGFEDLLEIGRQARPDLYNLMVEKPPPLAPREMRFGVAGRLRCDGSEIEPVDPAQLEALGARLAGIGVEGVAICLLHSYADTSHEQRVAEALGRAGIIVSTSSSLVPEYREFERASTVAVNAAVAPAVSGYLTRLASSLKEIGVERIRVMGSNAGALSPATAGREAVRTVLSGPAGGVRAAMHVGRMIGRTRLIAFDMGGTSTDVCLIPGEIRVAGEAVVAGHPVKTPAIDIHTVGAGGGSVAWRDAGGALRVGPASAGADPGPACYGRGGPPTVTDANLILGRVVPSWFLDGRMALHEEAARGAIAQLARQVGMSPLAAAEGILDVAEATVARAIRVISLHRGYEPSDHDLLAFGGAGGLHAASLARALETGRAVIPADAGVFSAFGMTVADIVVDRSATLLLEAAPAGAEALVESIGSGLASLEAQCRRDLQAEGAPRERIRFERSFDARYAGQSYEVNIPWGGSAGWMERFHQAHKARFGYQRRGERVEVVAIRVRGIGGAAPPAAVPIDGTGRSTTAADCGDATLWWRGEPIRAKRYARSKLPPVATDAGAGAGSVAGPALILEPNATTFVPPGWLARLDPLGHLHLTGQT